jgi:hypothetical protein
MLVNCDGVLRIALMPRVGHEHEWDNTGYRSIAILIKGWLRACCCGCRRDDLAHPITSAAAVILVFIALSW